MENLNDIFNLPTDVNEITKNVAKSGKSVDENLYLPSIEDAADGVYKATLRFLPNINNVKLSTISKYVYYLTDANKENGFLVDDPSTIGEKSPIGAMYWKLFNSKNAVDKEMAKNFNRNYYNYSLVEIIKDVQHPELEGKIKVFRYGVTIKTKIEDESTSDESCNVFDLYSGKNFNLIMEKKAGYNNYDRSKFSSTITPVTIDGEKMGTSNADRERIIEFLKEGSPDLSKYEYVEWDDETRDRVNKLLRTYMGEHVDEDYDDNPIESVRNQTFEKKASKPAKPAGGRKKEDDDENQPSSSDDFFNMEDIDL